VGLSLLHFGPWAIVTSLFTLGAIRSQWQLGKTNQQIKEKVGTELSKQIRDSAHERAREFGQEVRQRLEEVKDAIHASLESNIQDLRREVEFALSERDVSEHQAAERDQALRGLIDELDLAGRSARGIFNDTARI
jgi:F0F1-type ATP synthase membrane subunit b/b'